MARSTIASLTTEVTTLRAENSMLRTQLEAAKEGSEGSVLTIAQRQAARIARTEKQHEYASHAEACENCKRLAAQPTLRHWTFSVVGNRVICRQRMLRAA